ncbi:MAG: cytochrome c3 family protein [Planctomycetota bacterium]|jgi:predicted CXXCH cytochrome family protein
MRGLKDYYIVFFQRRTALIGLMLLVFLGIFVVSCDEVKHHDVLTFFFEGVPPLEEGQLAEEPDDFDPQKFLHTRPEQLWYVHQPTRDCTLCHDFSRRRGFSSQTYLINPVPELCYQCHVDYTTSASYVHGPVAVGRCLFCHNPHKSRIEHLLIEPEPQLCYLCHNIDAMKLIPAHLVKQQFACTDCHNAHTSSVKFLLNEESALEGNTVEGIESVDGAVQSQNLAGLTEAKRATELESQSMFQVFWTVSKLIERDQIKEARAYLGNFKKSNTFTNEEWIKIVQVLNLMDFAATGTEGYAEKVKQQKAAVKVGPEGPITKREISSSQLSKNKREIAELYYLSLAYYYAGQLEKAREGLVEVLKNDSIPPDVAKTIQDDLANIDKNLTISDRKRGVAELYYRSMAFYQAGQFEKAREGLVKVLKSGLVPEPMIITIKGCLTNIDNILGR